MLAVIPNHLPPDIRMHYRPVVVLLYDSRVSKVCPLSLQLPVKLKAAVTNLYLMLSVIVALPLQLYMWIMERVPLHKDTGDGYLLDGHGQLQRAL